MRAAADTFELMTCVLVVFWITSFVELYFDENPILPSIVDCDMMRKVLKFLIRMSFSPSINSSISRGVRISDRLDIVVRSSVKRKYKINASAFSSESLELLRIVLTAFC
jgi:hypothetical protein